MVLLRFGTSLTSTLLSAISALLSPRELYISSHSHLQVYSDRMVVHRMPPGKNMDDYLTMFRSGMWRLNYRLSAEGKKRFFTEFLPLLHDTKHAVLGEHDDDSWYLVYIGTRPPSRGKGYARKLIEHVTRKADRDGKLCYLESSNPINPAIYRKLGFEERRKVHLQRAEKDVELDIMVREPVKMENEKGQI